MKGIYVMSDGSLVKIGSARNPTQRRKTLQTGNGKEIVLHLTVSWHDEEQIKTIETACHKALRKYRVNGEWFSCSLYVAIGCVIDITQCLVGRKIITHTPRARNLLTRVADVIAGKSEWDSQYDFVGSDQPWPKGAFWWFDDTKGHVVEITWIGKATATAR